MSNISLKLKPEDYKHILEQANPLAWVDLNEFVNETQQRIEFSQHSFLIDPFLDFHPDQVIRKSAQVGFSVTAIFKSLWLAKYKKLNIIYALPTNDIIKGFVQPKVDPLIVSNPLISNMVTSDSMSLKQVGERFIHFKGTGSQREAITTSADLLVIDEYDRALDMNVVNTFDSRLQYSEYAWRWRFSNPSQVGFGVDGLYQDSDQLHWFVKCHHCSHEWYMDFDKLDNELNHYVSIEQEIYACGKCGKALNDDDRRAGRWVAKYPQRKRRGYWISQMMAPWVHAARIIEQKNESNTEFFYNFVLGKAFTPSDLIVNRETILRACVPQLVPKVNVVIGVDQNVNEQIWVAATPQGIFAHGRTKNWDDLERLKLTWNAIVVCDPQPYPTMPKKLADKYHDFYLCRFQESNDLQIIHVKDQDIRADRTRLIDTVANEITSTALLFTEHPQDLEDYIADWSNLYRTTEEKEDGRTRSVWKKKENKESDFSLATAYMRVGLSFIIGMGNSQFIEPTALPDGTVSGMVEEQGEILGNIVTETMDQFDD